MEHRPVFSIEPLVAAYPEPDPATGDERRWVIVLGNDVLYMQKSPLSTVVFSHPLPPGIIPEQVQYLGCRDSIPYYAAAIGQEGKVPRGSAFSAVRALHGMIPDDQFALAAYAVRILQFDRTSRFCGRCGKETRPLRTERARLCTDCNYIVYPRLSPAIIVLIKKGDEVLLARSPRFPHGLFSIIAGFVEPGENLEQAVRREVKEEVGISVKNIRYIASEPWPFPDSLMIGFVADYAGGEITIDNKEISAAGWFSRTSLPPLPSMMSISRALIEAWVRNEI